MSIILGGRLIDEMASKQELDIKLRELIGEGCLVHLNPRFHVELFYQIVMFGSPFVLELPRQDLLEHLVLGVFQ